MDLHGWDRTKVATCNLADLGITKTQSSRWQRAAIAYDIQKRRSVVRMAEQRKEAAKLGGRGNTREKRETESDTLTDSVSVPKPKTDTRKQVGQEAGFVTTKSIRLTKTIEHLEKS